MGKSNRWSPSPIINLDKKLTLMNFFKVFLCGVVDLGSKLKPYTGTVKSKPLATAKVFCVSVLFIKTMTRIKVKNGVICKRCPTRS